MIDVDVTVDLRAAFGPVRDQGSRPTCLAFAVSDAHAAVRDGWMALSCEYLFFHSQCRSGGSFDEGASISATLDALRDAGQPEEKGWPYLNVEPTDTLANWKPPEDVGTIFRRVGRVGTDAIDELIAEVDAGNPVLLLMMLSPSFFFVPPSGLIQPTANEQPNPAQRHAVIAMGYGERKSDRMILIRNSWGKGWAASGYAWLPVSFLTDRMLMLGHILEDPDVPA